jgi:hypothetical protein
MTAQHVPTEKDRKVVETMAGLGVPQDGIARTIGISEPTLRKHYSDELSSGMTKANAAVAQALYQTALGEGKASIIAAIFWLKCRAAWCDKAGERQAAMGKKELAQEAAMEPPSADSEWGDDLNVVPFKRD